LYSKLNPPLTSGEALFIIQLMNFKWNKRAPFPSYGLLAKRMGLSDKAVRRHAAALEAKKYLYRIQRVGATNKFDLSKLFDALLEAKAKFGIPFPVEFFRL
jgi:DNA-binding transcriptional MocR family regulator